MHIRYLGHSAFEIEGSKKVYIDPFLTGNPVAALTAEEITEADIVLVTHDHEDHIGDAIPICKKTGATLYSTHEIATMAAEKGVRAEGMNIGGTLKHEGVHINMVNAEHTAYKGHVVGFVLQTDGINIYHAGDTGLFGDMQIIGEFFPLDVALIPIGDRYTMGLRSATRAVEYLKPKKVIPMHYNTFPLIEQNPEDFKNLVVQSSLGDQVEVAILKPGEALPV